MMRTDFLAPTFLSFKLTTTNEEERVVGEGIHNDNVHIIFGGTVFQGRIWIWKWTTLCAAALRRDIVIPSLLAVPPYFPISMQTDFCQMRWCHKLRKSISKGAEKWNKGSNKQNSPTKSQCTELHGLYDTCTWWYDTFANPLGGVILGLFCTYFTLWTSSTSRIKAL